ncbi:acyl-CoA dehydrogenase family protein [Dyadobacter subterraneus]|uniref:Acyl-CoA dehydrogenase family protein n=2 Tax=Dyadobacter subterraneus TaxID=2773304 RepID=A0ABR9W7L1_9BACT|nr:acyl-CoA dehydrogenase family protein [Dyadobacter subterraneus]MBE9461453.1 acyl-CoA dehydrogenase family protein [Dyadobacter subterraneus]
MDHLFSSQLYQKIAQNAAHIDHEGCFPEQEFKLIAEAGLLEIVLPSHSLDFSQRKNHGLLMLLKAIGKASLPVGRIYEGHINALYLIYLFGKTEQKQRWFADVILGKKMFSVWNTQDMEGVRIYDLGNGKYRLQGCKTFCSGASRIARPLVTGELVSARKKGWQMVIIPTEKVKEIKMDNSFWKPLGMRASASFRMDFSGIEISENDLLGLPDAYYQQPHFSGGALRFAAVQLGGAEALLDETHKFLRGLKRTDDPFQRARIAEIAYLTETGNLWIKQAGLKTDDSTENPEAIAQLLAYVNMTRTMVEEICLRSMQLAERSVGARGLMRPNPMERIHRDLTTYLRQPAPDATLTAIGEYVLKQESTTGIWDSLSKKSS